MNFLKKKLAKRRILASGLFDAEFYLNQYPDVADAGHDPLEHFLMNGGRESRSPSWKFDGPSYVLNNPTANYAENILLDWLDNSKNGKRVPPSPVAIPKISGFSSDAAHLDQYKAEELKKAWFTKRQRAKIAGMQSIRRLSHLKIKSLLVHRLTASGEIDSSLALLILKALRPSLNKNDASNLLFHLESGWKSGNIYLDFAEIPSQKRENIENLALSSEDMEAMIQKNLNHLKNSTLCLNLKNIADQSWYSACCNTIGLLDNISLRMDIHVHYILIGRYFRINLNPAFDPEGYINNVKSIVKENISAEISLIHYFSTGEALSVRPCAFFNPQYYAARYDTNGHGSFVHYVMTGAAMDNQPSAAFWSKWYREKYAVEQANLLGHFYTVGLEEGFLPNPLIDIDWYHKNNGAAFDVEPLRHYASRGFTDDLPPHVLINPDFIQNQDGFDGMNIMPPETSVEFYLRNASVISPNAFFDTPYYLRLFCETYNIDQPLHHYLTSEFGGNKRPNRYFDENFYLDFRPDIKVAGMSALVHYCQGGYKESVKVHPLVDHDLLPRFGPNKPPLEALLTGEAGMDVPLRRIQVEPDSANKSKWLPVALNIDQAARAYEEISTEGCDVGLLAHVFYVDLLREVLAVAENLPRKSRILISTDTRSKKQAIENALKNSNLEDWEVRVFANRGRDILPSFFGFHDRLRDVKYALHVHTKKSRHYGQSFDKWRQYLFHENGGSPRRVEAILKTFSANPSLGALAPVDFGPLRRLISWGYNQPLVGALLGLAGHQIPLEKVSLEFPSGSMFWFRIDALKGLLHSGLEPDHFDPEAGQVDGTLAHAIERAFFMLIEAEGYDWARFCSGDKLGGYRVTDNIDFARSRLLPPVQTKDAVVIKFPETASFFSRAIDNAKPRLNLLIPTADQQMGYAGVSEAVRQFRAIGKELDPTFDLRIISTDVPFDNMTIPPAGFSVADSLVDEHDMLVVPGFLRGTEPLGLRANDVFVASAWWNAQQAYDLIEEQGRLFGHAEHRRMVYLIQDFEPGFYAWSTRWALAENTYRHPDQTIAIFNTPLLADFMNTRYSFSMTQTFKPMINENLVIPSEDQLPVDKRDKIVLLYARPHAERNCLEMLDAIVSECVNDSPEFWNGWRFLAIGETFQSGILQCDRIEVLGRLDLSAYREYLGKSRLGVSIMVSPHPSYPPLEMAANGVRVLTNTYEGKDLAQLHENLESFTLFEPKVLAKRLKAMAQSSARSGKPLVDWFFEGGNNLKSVATAVAEELRKSVKRVR